MAAPLLEQWAQTSAADQASMQEAFGDLKPKPSVVVLIGKAHIQTQEASPVDIAMIVTVLRDLLGPFWFEEGVLIKEDADRFFVTCSTSEAGAKLALSAVRRVEALRRSTPLGKFLVGFSCGLAVGDILMRDGPGGDLFGVAVDMARKLAEEVAKPGEVLVAQAALAAGQGGSGWPLPEVTSEVGSCVISNSSVKYTRLKGADPGPEEHADMITGLEDEDADDPIIQLFLSLVRGQTSDQRALIEQHVNKVSLVAADLSGVTLVTQTKGLVQYLLLVAKERLALKELMVKYGGEVVRWDGDKVVGKFDHPIQAMGCAAETHVRLNAQAAQSRNDPCRVVMCVGIEHGSVLNTGDDLFGWPWDVAYALSESAGGTSHDVLIGPGIHEVTKSLWEAPAGTKLEARPVFVKESKVACQCLVATVAPIEASGGALTARKSLQATGGVDGVAGPQKAVYSMNDDPFLKGDGATIAKPASNKGGLSFSMFCCSGRRG